MTSRAPRFAWCLVGALSVTPLYAQQGAFIVTAGHDTIAVESFQRSAERVSGELHTVGNTLRLLYTLDLVNGLPTGFTNKAYTDAADSSWQGTSTMKFQGDSVFYEIQTKAGPITQRLLTKSGAFPFINLSFSLIEPALAKARAKGGAADTVPLLIVQGGRTVSLGVAWLGADSAVLDLGGVQLRVRINARGEILGGSVPAQNVRIIRAARAPDLMAHEADYSAPPGASFTAEDVTIKATPGHTLAGTLTLPKQRPGPVPVVVTISGAGLQNRDQELPGVDGYKPFREIAEALAAAGIGVLRFDDRGYGASTGNATNATSEDFANDVRDVLAYLRTRSDVNAHNLFLLGHSEGGVIAPLVARTDTSLRGILLLAGPAYTGRRIIENEIRRGITNNAALAPAKRDSLTRAAFAELDSVAKVQPWMGFFLTYDPLPTARAVKVPVLILQGANDRQVTADQAEPLAAAFRAGGNQDVTVHVIPGVNHLFLTDSAGNPAKYGELQDRKLVAHVVELITDWTAKHIK